MSGQILHLPRLHGEAEHGDEALVRSCAKGDARALDALFLRHRTAVARFFGRMLGNHIDLEDLVQGTFLEVWKSAPRYQGRAAVRSWILGIANNLFRHYARGESRRRSALRVLADERVPPDALPDEAAAQRQLVERMQVALLELPHNLRTTFVLCELEGVPRDEAALVLGVRFGSIGRRIHEARKALREAIERGPG